MPSFCTNCGERLPEHVNYCGECGTRRQTGEKNHHDARVASEGNSYTVRHHKAARYIQARVRASIDRKSVAGLRKTLEQKKTQAEKAAATPKYWHHQVGSGSVASSEAKRRQESGAPKTKRDGHHRNQAATKIQAIFRGNRDRGRAVEEKRRYERTSSKTKHDGHRRNQAATRIQARFRGIRDRGRAGEEKRRSKRLKNPMLGGRKQMPGTAQLRDVRVAPTDFCGAGRAGANAETTLRGGRLMLAPQAADWRSQKVLASRSPLYPVSANPCGRGPMIGVQRNSKPATPEKVVRTHVAGAGSGSISALQDLSLPAAVDRIATVGREWRSRHQDAIDAKKDPFLGIYTDTAPYGYGPNGVMPRHARNSSPTPSSTSNTSGMQMRPSGRKESIALDPVSRHLGFTKKTEGGQVEQIPTDVYAKFGKQNRLDAAEFGTDREGAGLLATSARLRAEALESAKSRLGAR